MQKSKLGEFVTLKPFLLRYRLQYFWGFLCLIVVDALQAYIPQFIRKAVDLITLGHFEWSGVLKLCLAMLGVMALISSGRFLWRYFIHGSSRRIEAELREKLFTHLLSLSYDFYQKNKIGDLMARAINDIGAVRNALGWGVVALVDGTVMAASILVIIFIQDPRSAALSILPLPVITLLIVFFGKAIGRRFQRAQETYSTMSDTVQESFAGIRVVKSFVKERWFTKKFAKTNDDYRDANMDLVKLFGMFFPLVSFLAGFTTLILLLVGGRRVVLGYISPGELVALFSYLQMLIWPLMGAGFMVNMIQRGAVSMARINEVLNTEPGIKSPENPGVPGKEDSLPELELKNLSFSYAGIGPPNPTEVESPSGNGSGQVLENISLSVKRGTVLGILGRTGSGKSTLLKTLVRMVEPPEGTVFIRGLDITRWELPELRRLFGVSPQDSYLFSDTIKNNIAYGAKTAGAAPGETAAGTDAAADNEIEPSLAELTGAAVLSALDKDLEGFSMGWETLIGERGLTLSGGQKQRVAIARAVLSAPEILILDDAFSAVDAETEKRILTGLLEARRPFKTTIIVSHRVSTLSCADQVLVLDKGMISEYGTPQELLALGNFFARMARLQQLGEIQGTGSAEASHV
jgi:ATP-binding cassette subfamily B protein